MNEEEGETKRKNTPIPWIAYIIIGILMGGYAKIVELKNPTHSSMALFFYIGIVFIIIGLGKLTMKYFFAKENKITAYEKKDFSNKLKEQTLKHKQNMNMKNNQHTEHNIIACPKCGTRHYSSSNFCHKCGTRLK